MKLNLQFNEILNLIESYRYVVDFDVIRIHIVSVTLDKSNEIWRYMMFATFEKRNYLLTNF